MVDNNGLGTVCQLLCKMIISILHFTAFGGYFPSSSNTRQNKHYKTVSEK